MNPPPDDPHGELDAGCFRFAVTCVVVAVVLGVALLFAGCAHFPGTAGSVVAQQTPGVATGAGATFTGPANSAAASTQTAARRVSYYPPPVRAPLPRFGSPARESRAEVVAPPVLLPSPAAPAWIDERTETTFGPHQDASGIIKAANFLAGWGKARWFGVLCLLGAAFGLAWAHNNPEGYPVICWKVGGIGLFLALFDPSPWWLLLLLIPAGFYLAQKLGLLRLPPL